MGHGAVANRGYSASQPVRDIDLIERTISWDLLSPSRENWLRPERRHVEIDTQTCGTFPGSGATFVALKSKWR